jgi:hypothetical protein
LIHGQDQVLRTVTTDEQQQFEDDVALKEVVDTQPDEIGNRHLVLHAVVGQATQTQIVSAEFDCQQVTIMQVRIPENVPFVAHHQSSRVPRFGPLVFVMVRLTWPIPTAPPAWRTRAAEEEMNDASAIHVGPG